MAFGFVGANNDLPSMIRKFDAMAKALGRRRDRTEDNEGGGNSMADKSPQMVTLMYRRVSGLSLVSGEDGEVLQWQYHGHRHGCFVFV